jgi:hypothetical protein
LAVTCFFCRREKLPNTAANCKWFIFLSAQLISKFIRYFCQAENVVSLYTFSAHFTCQLNLFQFIVLHLALSVSSQFFCTVSHKCNILVHWTCVGFLNYGSSFMWLICCLQSCASLSRWGPVTLVLFFPRNHHKYD